MNRFQTEFLSRQLAVPTLPVAPDPWSRSVCQHGGEEAIRTFAARPDFGWAFARLQASHGRGVAVLKRPEYRWVRAALLFLTSGKQVMRRIQDVGVVSRAKEINDSDLRPVINAALITRGATVQNVSAALGLEGEVVASYESLFFNVLERKNDLGYIRNLVGGTTAESSLVFSRRTVPSDEETLLMIGYRGTIDDVLHYAGASGIAGDASVEDLGDRVLRNLLVAGADWTASQVSRRHSPPDVVSHAIDFVKRSKADTAQDPLVQSGMSIGATLREQLAADADLIRAGMAHDLPLAPPETSYGKAS